MYLYVFWQKKLKAFQTKENHANSQTWQWQFDGRLAVFDGAMISALQEVIQWENVRTSICHLNPMKTWVLVKSQ